MYERIIEIIVLVISELRQKRNIDDIDIEDLQSRGYTNSEISTALSWLADRMEFTGKYNEVEEQSQQTSFRILHDVETDLFTQEAWGEIIQLNSLGILSNEMVEVLIEKAAMMGMRNLETDQLRMFVANSIFNVPINSEYGSRFMLQGNDTIN